MRRLGRIFALALTSVGLLVPVASAQAAEVAFHFGDTLRFLPNAGEVNTVTLQRGATVYVVTDSTTPLTAGLGCTAVNANTVTCPIAGVEDIDFDFGDLDDTGTVAASVIGGQDLDLFWNGQDGNDTLNAGSAVEFGQYFGSNGNDTLNGGPERDRLLGGDGDDGLFGGGEGDSLDGGEDADTVRGQGGDGDSVDPGSSEDGADFLSGGAGIFDDISYRNRDIGVSITMNGQPDDGESCPGAGCEGDNVAGDFERIDGTEGDDVITSGARPEVIFAGEGNDVVNSGSGSDEVFADEGNDRISGGPGDDDLGGRQGADRINGNAGDDFLDGDAFGVTNPDDFNGGRGLDLVDFEGADEPLRVDLDGVADDGRPGEGDNIRASVEDVIGGDLRDVLIGNGSANELIGGGGDDKLIGRGGADGLVGERGADLLTGGKGPDSMDGGSGPDRLRSRDGRRDQVSCGSAFDRALADRPDKVEADCDRIRRRG